MCHCLQCCIWSIYRLLTDAADAGIAFGWVGHFYGVNQVHTAFEVTRGHAGCSLWKGAFFLQGAGKKMKTRVITGERDWRNLQTGFKAGVRQAVFAFQLDVWQGNKTEPSGCQTGYTNEKEKKCFFALFCFYFVSNRAHLRISHLLHSLPSLSCCPGHWTMHSYSEMSHP